MSVEIIEISEFTRVRVEYDEDPSSPAENDNLGQIAYCSSRYTLGTENVSSERLREIHDGLKDGSLIGAPVFAYIHSGSSISMGGGGYPYNCPWDGGQSGFVYAPREAVLENWSKKRVTKKLREQALACLKSQVEEFDQYLRGDVYGYVVETKDEGDEDSDWEQGDSCWGFFGLDYAKGEAQSAGEWAEKERLKTTAALMAAEVKEEGEVAFWAARDVVTTGVHYA